MDLELFPLVVGLAIGGLFGARGKSIMKPIAKGYLALSDRIREMTANMREDMRDAVEEARYERERDAALDEEAESAEETTTVTRAPRRRRRSAAG